MSFALMIFGLLAAAVIVAVVVVIAIFIARKPPPDTHQLDRKPQLFNAAAEDLTLQSADNLRLFSEAQLKEIEDRDSE